MVATSGRPAQPLGASPLAHRRAAWWPLAATMHRLAKHESARPQWTNPQEEEDVDAGPEVGPGAQEARRRAAATRRLHARRDRDPKEAELGSAKDRPRPADQRARSDELHSGGGAQPAGALCGARPRRPGQGL